MSPKPSFRRAPNLILYWTGDQLILHNYSTGTQVSVDPVVSTILHFFDRWRSVEALSARFPEFRSSSLAAVASALERQSLLVRRGRPVDRTSAALASWAAWNPAAGFFHFTTKDVQFARDHERAERSLRGRATTRPMPSPIKRHPGAPRSPLPPVSARGELVDVLRARRTWRRFSRRPVNIADLSTVLGLTFGVEGWIDLPGIGRTPRKTAPSGGSRHPIEAYVVARRVAGLKKGLYHYRPDSHELEHIGAAPRTVVQYLPTQTWFNAAAALVLMTAVFPRVQWRYQFPRAYRVVLADAGHVCQTFCLVATWLGLAPFCTMALADSRIEKDLGIDGVSESVVYAAGVGTRPRVTPGVSFDPG